MKCHIYSTLLSAINYMRTCGGGGGGGIIYNNFASLTAQKVASSASARDKVLYKIKLLWRIRVWLATVRGFCRIYIYIKAQLIERIITFDLEEEISLHLLFYFFFFILSATLDPFTYIYSARPSGWKCRKKFSLSLLSSR